MIGPLLARLFPPELGTVDYDVILRLKIAAGEIATVDPGFPEEGIANLTEWQFGLWNKAVRLKSGQGKSL